MHPHASRLRRPDGLHLAHPDIGFALVSLAPLVSLFSPLERECAQRVAFARHPRTSRVCGRTASTVWTKKPRPRSLPICLNEADLATMRQIDVGRILHQHPHSRGIGLFSGLVKVAVHQGRKGDTWLIQQTIQCFGLFPGVHLSGQRTQGILRQTTGRLYRASRATPIVELDAPKGLLGPALGSQPMLVCSSLIVSLGKMWVRIRHE